MVEEAKETRFDLDEWAICSRRLFAEKKDKLCRRWLMLRINSSTLFSQEILCQESKLTSKLDHFESGPHLKSSSDWMWELVERVEELPGCNQIQAEVVNHCRIFETEPPWNLVWLWSRRMLGSKLAGAPRLLALELPAGRTKPINYIPQGELYNVPNNFSGRETQIDLLLVLSQINLTHAQCACFVRKKGSSWSHSSY